MGKAKVVLVGALLLCTTSVAEAGVFSTIGNAGIAVWNLLPGAVRVVNSGIHFVCSTVHSGLHGIADFLQIENLP